VGRNQMIFDEIFRNQTYGLRNGLESRSWQQECHGGYFNSIRLHEEALATNGDASHQHVFTIFGGTGCGKTKGAGLIVSTMLNGRKVGQVVVVVPNRSILHKTQKDFRHFFGIDLVRFHARRYADGIPRTKQGYVLTYGHLMQDPTLHRRICGSEPTLVIFDEVHHLGDGNGWGDAALEAFGSVPYVLCLTGTPYRSDNRRIPFVRYEEKPGADGLFRFSAEPPYGFCYPLGQAVTDGVCRKPLFRFHDARVKYRFGPDSGESEVTFDDTNVSDTVASLRLRGAVKYGSSDRRRFLEATLAECRENHRKVIIFLGGDTEGDQTPTVDATELLPAELQEIGISPEEYDVVTGDDPESQGKIVRFGKSEKWLLISINMVSEGTDIPEISAAVFLTSITAKQTTVQRIGRALRLMGDDDPHTVAWVFMFRDPVLVQLAGELNDEMDKWEEIKIRRERKAKPDDDETPTPRNRAEAIGIGDGAARVVVFHGRQWPFDVFERARDQVRDMGLPATLTETAMYLLMGDEHHVRC
jgi:hypothetical protein